MSEQEHDPQWRSITTKKAARALCCGELVAIGTNVRWHPDKGVRHLPGACGRGLQSLAPTEPRPDLEQPVMADNEVLSSGERLIAARRASTCRVCGQDIEKGAPIWWKPGESVARHSSCEPVT
jgi:hypothetical protein